VTCLASDASREMAIRYWTGIGEHYAKKIVPYHHREELLTKEILNTSTADHGDGKPVDVPGIGCLA
jgi:hypothetical protein